MNIYTNCPHCGVSWDGGDIPEEYHDFYTQPYKYSRVIGLYSREEDKTTAWKCPDCGKTWSRE